MLASFSIIPVGVGEELKEHIAGLVPIIESSGLDYAMGAMQTTVEGDGDKIIELIMNCHKHMRKKAKRVVTHIAIDDRDGAANRLKGKVRDVEQTLGRSIKNER